MITIRYARKCLAAMGFKRNQHLNRQLLLGILLPISNVFLTVMFVSYEANSFWEYTNAIFVCLVSSVDLLLFIIFIVQAWRIFEIIDVGQKFVEDSM